MTNDVTTEIEGSGLLAEVERYLAAIETFRAAGREPTWLPEPLPLRSAPSRHRVRRSCKSGGGIA
jgi:hypothetical protein